MPENPNSLEERPVDLREVLRVLWRRRWLFVIPCVVTVVGGVAGAFLLPSVYESSVVLMMEGPQQLPANLRGMVGRSNTDAQAEIMSAQVRDSVFLRSVITTSGIRTDPATRAWALRSASRYPGFGEDEVVDAFLADYLRQAIVVLVLRAKGNVFQITVADRDGARAHKLAKAVSNQFVTSSKATQLQEVGKIQEFRAGQQQVYKRKLEEAEQRLEAFRRNVISSTVVGTTVNGANAPRARMLSEQSQLEAEALRQRMAGIRQQLGGKMRDEDLRAIATSEALGLAAQMVTLERQLASMTLTDPTGEGLGGMRLSILRRRGDLASELALNAVRVLPLVPAAIRDPLVDYRMAQADLAGVEARREWLERQIAAYERSQVMSPDRQLQEQRLSQEVETWRSLHNTFLQQSAEVQIAEAFENARVNGRFVILQPATRPSAPVRPNRPALILFSLIAGLVIGAGAVKVVEHQDQSVKNAEEVEKLLGLPVLGALPRVAELEVQRRRPMPFANAPGGVTAPREHGMLHRLKVESPLGLEFRRIFLKLARTRGRQLPHTLLVTSATRGEGKTTTAACLAITLARELRQKVLLVDFDLRSPALHRALGLPSSSWGLAQILGQRHFDERFVRATVLPHLEFLPAGKSDRPASELIESELVEWFVKEAASRYPVVIMDCAPNLAVPDPLILGRAVEGVLYVVKAGSTVRKAAEYGVKVQREARDNVLGVLINDAGEILPSYYGYRSHSYGGGQVAGGES